MFCSLFHLLLEGSVVAILTGRSDFGARDHVTSHSESSDIAYYLLVGMLWAVEQAMRGGLKS